MIPVDPASDVIFDAAMTLKSFKRHCRSEIASLFDGDGDGDGDTADEEAATASDTWELVVSEDEDEGDGAWDDEEPATPRTPSMR